jgi:hypothetical protein
MPSAISKIRNGEIKSLNNDEYNGAFAGKDFQSSM